MVVIIKAFFRYDRRLFFRTDNRKVVNRHISVFLVFNFHETKKEQTQEEMIWY